MGVASIKDKSGCSRAVVDPYFQLFGRIWPANGLRRRCRVEIRHPL